MYTRINVGLASTTGSRTSSSSASVVLSSDISRRNPQDDYELLQRIGSGTYGDVYKVSKRMLDALTFGPVHLYNEG